MAKNIKQVFDANPAASMVGTDLLYLGRSPFSAANDMAITWTNLLSSIATGGFVRNGTDDLTIFSGVESDINITPDLGNINIKDKNNASTVAMRFFDTAGDHYTALQANSVLGSNTTFKLPVSNVTNGLLTTDGSNQWAFTLTPSGLTSLGVGSLTLSGVILSSTGNIRLSPSSGGVINVLNNSSAGQINFYNAAGTQYTGLVAGNPGSSLAFTLPVSFPASTQFLQSTTAGVMSFATAVTSITAGSNLTGGTITGSGTIALSATPSGLTSLGVGDLSLSAGLIAANNGVTITGVTSGSAVVLSPNNGFVAINDLGNSIATPLRFYNSAGTQYVGFRAGTLAGSTTWTWPTSDVAGVMVSNGSGAFSLTTSPSVTSMSIGNLSLSTSTISTNQSTLVLSATGTNSVISLKTTGASGYVEIRNNIDTQAVPLRFYDGNFPTNYYVSFKASNSMSADVSFTWPYVAREGVMASDGSGNLSLEYAPAIQKPMVSFVTTSKTLALSDKNTFQVCNNASTQTVTVPPNSSVNFLDGVEIEFFQQGAGQVVFVAGVGVTILSAFSNLKIGAQYTGAVLKQLVTNTWALVGNLTA